MEVAPQATLDDAVTCKVCFGDLPRAEFPAVPLTEACQHESTCCKSCIQRCIESQVQTEAWDSIRCPECPGFLSFHEVKRSISEEAFKL